MTEATTIDTTPPAAAPVTVKKKQIEAKNPADKKAKKSKAAKTAKVEFDFIGKVRSVHVKAKGATGHPFQFTLMAKKDTKSYVLDASDAQRFSSMANLLTAASISGAKVKIRAINGVDGAKVADELEFHMKG